MGKKLVLLGDIGTDYNGFPRTPVPLRPAARRL